MRTRPLILGLAFALIASPVVAAIRVPDEPLVWTVVPRPGPSVGVGLAVAAANPSGVLGVPDADPRLRPLPSDRSVPLPVAIPPPVPVALLIIVDRPSQSSGHRESGTASYYCNSDPSRGRTSRCTVGLPDGRGDQLYAAIRRDLLADLRGRRVRVCGNGHCVSVTVIDCNCGPDANLIDLYGDAMARLVPLTRGTVSVVVSW